MEETIDYNKLYRLCNDNKWFTCGSNSQYDKLFKANRNKVSVRDLSVIIWICSDNITIESIETILTQVWYLNK